MYNQYAENQLNVPIIDKEGMSTFYDYAGADLKDPNAGIVAFERYPDFPPTYFANLDREGLDGEEEQPFSRRRGL